MSDTEDELFDIESKSVNPSSGTCVAQVRMPIDYNDKDWKGFLSKRFPSNISVHYSNNFDQKSRTLDNKAFVSYNPDDKAPEPSQEDKQISPVLRRRALPHKEKEIVEEETQTNTSQPSPQQQQQHMSACALFFLIVLSVMIGGSLAYYAVMTTAQSFGGGGPWAHSSPDSHQEMPVFTNVDGEWQQQHPDSHAPRDTPAKPAMNLRPKKP